jgi:hypothetical protein
LFTKSAKQQSIQPSLTFNNFSEIDLDIYINNLKEVETILAVSFNQQVSFSWNLMLRFFAVTSSIHDKFNSIALKKLNIREQELYELILKWGRSATGLNRSSSALLTISLEEIYFSTTELKELLNQLNDVPELHDESIQEINLQQLAKLGCFENIFPIHTYFHKWLSIQNTQLLEILVSIRSQM